MRFLIFHSYWILNINIELETKLSMIEPEIKKTTLLLSYLKSMDKISRSFHHNFYWFRNNTINASFSLENVVLFVVDIGKHIYWKMYISCMIEYILATMAGIAAAIFET